MAANPRHPVRRPFLWLGRQYTKGDVFDELPYRHARLDLLIDLGYLEVTPVSARSKQKPKAKEQEAVDPVLE